jgi:hypothetical protein
MSVRWFAAVGSIVVALAAVSTSALAAAPKGHGVLHSPNGAYKGHSPGYWLAQWWAGALSAPADDSNPLISGGCVLRGKVAIRYGGDCTVPPGTAVFMMLFSTECSNREEEPFFADDAATAGACGRANAGVATALDLSVDGGPVLHLLDDDFSAVMPFTTVAFPEDNIFGVPNGDGTISFGGFGYAALINPLSRGTHTIDFVPQGEGAPPPDHGVITVGT